jgi:hypothetical protein
MPEQGFSSTICGRRITVEDLNLIRQLINDHPGALRTEISRRVCLAWHWFKPDGGLKEMSCRVLLLKLHRDGLISLPLPRNGNHNGRKFERRSAAGEPGALITQPVGQLLPLQLQRIVTKKDSLLWNELIERYHYLGYTPLPGAQIRYFIQSPQGLLAAIGFSAAAWKVEPRDHWIGWSKNSRVQNLRLIINNSRFLILPWVQSKNLASKILSLCAKQLPQDWQALYGYTPVLLETFVEKVRFTGTCYQAANWIWVGVTKGRGKLDRYNLCSLPVKDIYLFPLHKNFRQLLQSI